MAADADVAEGGAAEGGGEVPVEDAVLGGLPGAEPASLPTPAAPGAGGEADGAGAGAGAEGGGAEDEEMPDWFLRWASPVAAADGRDTAPASSGNPYAAAGKATSPAMVPEDSAAADA